MGLMQQQSDWYGYLKLSADAPIEQVEQAVERLSRQAAALAVTAPERSQQLRDTVRAIKRDLLSGEENRARYDAARAAASVPPPPSAATAPSTPSTPSPSPAPAPSPSPSPAQPPRPAWGGPAGGERMSSRIARFLRTGWTCSACGKEMLPNDKFCTRCGTVITPTRHDVAPAVNRAACVNCSAQLGPNDGFCAKCGTRVEK